MIKVVMYIDSEGNKQRKEFPMRGHKSGGFLQTNKEDEEAAIRFIKTVAYTGSYYVLK